MYASKIEAESVAFVVARLAGSDTSAYSVGCVAGWAETDVELIRGIAAGVLATAHRTAMILGDPRTRRTPATSTLGGKPGSGRPL